MVEICEETVTLRDGRSVRLGPIRPEHAGAYIAYMLSVSEESPWSGMVPSEVRTEDEQRKVFAAPDERGLHWRLGVWDDEAGIMVGDCSLSRSDRVKFTHVARLGIGVRAGWRGCGLGRILMERAIDAARADPEVLRLELLVFAKNDIARNLYRSMGLIEEGHNAGSVRQPDGSFDDDVHMAMRVGD